MLINARFFIGMNFTFAASAAPMLVIEVSYPVCRVQLTSAYNSLWYSGNIVVSWTTFGTPPPDRGGSPPSSRASPPCCKSASSGCTRVPSLPSSPPTHPAHLQTLAYYHADGDENEVHAADCVLHRRDPAYHLRAKGFNVFNFVISLALIFNQYGHPIALAHLKWKYDIVHVVWLAFDGAFIHFNILETKNLSLEETAALFDGKEAVECLEQVAHVAQGKHEVKEDVNEKGSGCYSPPELSYV
ncbi:hypothetical protein FIBSPDRAFT_1053552 [Athelia psychrophila]|uniref:Uncharacterized protein n=1 Tax=Athelia psychrophila TaxID=1759441 RepID=A0A167WRP7_9AGAM|nr:hypothetical protein FIBSPDRAFT_1053552 [Fibularhizoctonia sp. CBS 109695]